MPAPRTSRSTITASATITPYFYRTHDYGKTWTKIVNGLATDQPSGSFARVIRADTKKQGLLFAGTESSMYVSFDDGDDWQSLMLNLPNTSYRDIVIKDNDLVVGTYGRSFWILDDISPLRQMTPAIASEPAHLFKPGDAIRVRRNVNGDTPFPPEVPHAKNPPPGALIYYYLSAPACDVALDVIDAAGTVVRHLSSAPIPPLNELPPPIADIWIEKPMPMPADRGTHRINWNSATTIRRRSRTATRSTANPGETPASPEGPLALPGVYTLKLTVDGKSYTQTVTVKNDPRSPASAADLQAQHDLQMKLNAGAREAWDGYQQVTAMRAAVGGDRQGHAAGRSRGGGEGFRREARGHRRHRRQRTPRARRRWRRARRRSAAAPELRRAAGHDDPPARDARLRRHGAQRSDGPRLRRRVRRLEEDRHRPGPRSTAARSRRSTACSRRTT